MIYRADIDSLRALAMFFVLMFHLRMPGFDFGFLGVDIFFVISGFLISSILFSNSKNGSYPKFGEFIKKRLLRLMPALLVVSIATLLFSLVNFSNNISTGVGGASFFSVLYLSNFYYIGSINYFNSEALLKPLLHTWTLSIEMQFYIVFYWFCAIFHFFGFKRKAFIYTSILIFLFSFFLAVLFSTSTSAYYFSPFRAYEFLFGVFAFFLFEAPIGKKFQEFKIAVALEIASLLLFFYAFSEFNTSTAFPSWAAIVPCLATVLLILSNSKGILGVVLESHYLSNIGRYSYSVYLVHWPIISLVALSTNGNQNEYLLGILATTACLSIISYKFIEIPFRRGEYFKLFPKWATATYCGFIFLIAGISFSTWTGVAKNERNVETKKMNELEIQISDQREKMDEFLSKENHLENFLANQGEKILIIGDSHAIDSYFAIKSSTTMEHNLNLYMHSIDEHCFDVFGERLTFFQKYVYPAGLNGAKPECKKAMSTLRTILGNEKIKLLLIAVHLTPEKIQDVKTMLEFISKKYSRRFNIAVKGSSWLPYNPIYFDPKSNIYTDINSQFFYRDRSRQIQSEQILSSLAYENHLEYWSLQDSICDENKRICNIVTKNGELLWADDSHWTFLGFERFGQAMFSHLSKYISQSPDKNWQKDI